MKMILLNEDCMTTMAVYRDNYFDLAIVDPPYGMPRQMDGVNAGGRMRKFKTDKPSWDIKPKKRYFEELMRVSKNQINWGGNNFIEHLYNTTGFIFWFKHQPVNNFADGEFAWTSFQIPAKCFDFMCFGAHGQDKGGKVHPTQKPVKLYNWLYSYYSEPGQKILDTHLGSGSNAIAAHYAKAGEFVGVEIDEDYYDVAVKRIAEQTRQEEFEF